MRNFFQTKNHSLKSKLNHALLFFSFVLILMLAIFATQMVSTFAKSTQNLSLQVSNTIISTLETHFLSIEQSAISLSGLQEVETLLNSEKAIDFHLNAKNVKEMLDKIYSDDNLVEDILIFTKDGVFSRLRGDLGNTSANRVFFLIQNVENTTHMSFKLENESYIGYISNIGIDNQTEGYLVYLMKNSNISNLFESLDYSDTLDISLVADDSIIVSTNTEYNDMLVSQMEKESSTLTVRQIGFTPYKIISSDQSIFKTLLPSLLAMALISLIGLISILLFAYSFMKQMFFDPMLKIIDSAEKLNTHNKQIPLTGQFEFDMLVEQINIMVVRISKNTNDMYNMKNKIQLAEIEKQQAIIISLKKQINAHFIVNSLNVLRRLIDKEEYSKSKLICEDLSSILQYVYNADEKTSCISEIMTLEKYIEIMQIRYPYKFNVSVDLPDDLFDIQIPRMLIQPIVENSIVHGFAFENNHNLSISVFQQNQDILFAIEDDGKGIEHDVLAKLMYEFENPSKRKIEEDGIDHIALLNIQQRIVSMFGTNYGITVKSELNKYTKVVVKLPISQNDNRYL